MKDAEPIRVVTCALLATTLLSSALHAQTVAEGGEPGLTDIVVTATKRSQSLQDTPASVSSLTGAQLEQRGVTDIEALARQTPGVVFGEQAGASFITIRGVGASVDIGIGEPSVATYVDGVFLPRQTMGFLQQVDLERVEIVRGPQGTLYGRNATGGAINFLSRRPSEAFEAGASVETGAFGRFEVDGFLSGALARGVQARLSGGYATDDGYVVNLVDDSRIADVNRYHLRGSLRLLPADGVTVDLAVQYENNSGATAWQQTLTPSTSPLVPPTARQTEQTNRLFADQAYEAAQETLIASAIVDWSISDAIALRATTGYIDHDSLATFDGDATDFGLVDVVGFERPSKSFSQEVTLSGKTGRLDWIVGAFYFQEDYRATIPAVLPNGIPGALPPGTVSSQELLEDTRSFALFADFSFAITDTIRLLGGGRWFNDRKDFRQTIGATIPGAGFFGDTDVRSSAREEKFLPKVGLQANFTRDIMGYVQFQQGQKSGGQNLAVLDTQYRPEAIDAYEVGLRSSFFDRRLAVNMAYFHYDYTDYQVTDLPGGTATFVQNTDARIDGLEIEVTARPTEGLQLDLGLSFLDARYTDFQSLDQAFPELGFQDLSGRQLNRAPDFSMNAGAQYRVPINSGFVDHLDLRGDIYHSSSVVLRYFGTENDIQRAYSIANLSATFAMADERVQLTGFVQNVGDTLYKRVVIYSPLQGAYLGNFARPRTWGLRLAFRY